MRFESLPEGFMNSLLEHLRNRLGRMLPAEVLADDFHLRETCRFWRGRIDGDRLQPADDRQLWHHQIRRESLPVFYARTQSLDSRLDFCEMGRSELVVAFHHTAQWLDTQDSDIPSELFPDSTVVRLLEIQESFFYGFSFHRDGTLLYVMPLQQPAYLFARTGYRRFLRPEQLARELNDAPSFLGVGPIVE